MCKTFSTIVVVIGAIVGILVNVLPADYLPNIVFIPKFFEVFLPILGAGALIKYLFCGAGSCPCCSKGECKKPE